MSDFDNLGPLTREVVRHAPADIVVGQMLASYPIGLYSDDPATMDRNLALWLKTQIAQRYGPPESFVLKKGRHG